MIRKSLTCVLNMPMNEGQGHPHDSSGFGNNGTNNGADWVSGDYGWALDFNGTSDYVNCGTDTSIVPCTSDFTLLAWAKLDDIPGGTYPAIFGKGDTGGGEWMFRFNTTTAMSFYASATYAPCIIPNAVDTWRRYAFVREGNDCYIYCDGVEVGSDTLVAVNLTSGKHLRIGNADAAAHRFINGSIADTRMYNRPWSPTEVTNDWNATKTRYGL